MARHRRKPEMQQPSQHKQTEGECIAVEQGEDTASLHRVCPNLLGLVARS